MGISSSSIMLGRTTIILALLVSAMISGISAYGYGRGYGGYRRGYGGGYAGYGRGYGYGSVGISRGYGGGYANAGRYVAVNPGAIHIAKRESGQTVDMISSVI